MHLWTDSTGVLYWLQSHLSRWRPFVANRCASIHDDVPKALWQQVKTRDNPADVVSRGCTPKELLKKDLWWYGPSWLKDERSPWTSVKDAALNPIEIPVEEKSKVVESHSKIILQYSWDVIHRYSSAESLPIA